MKWEAMWAVIWAWASTVLPVPFNVVVGCIAGAYASFSFGEKVAPRSRMFNLWFACVIMGVAITAVTNGVIAFVFEGFKLTPGVQVGIGAIVSCLTRFVLPAIIEQIKPWLASLRIPFLSKNKPQGD